MLSNINERKDDGAAQKEMSKTIEQLLSKDDGAVLKKDAALSKKSKRLLIIGASGHGRVCADIADKMKLWDETVFADDHPPTDFPYPIIGGSSIEWDEDCFIGIGNSAIREHLSEGRRLATLIHPNAVIGERVTIGCGSVVMAGAVINPDVVIGEGAIINTCASVDHDCMVDSYAHIAVGAHLCGTVRVGCHTWIGAGATVKNNVNICGGCVIGAGAVVVRDITESGTYMGVPAVKYIDKLQTFVRRRGKNV